LTRLRRTNAIRWPLGDRTGADSNSTPSGKAIAKRTNGPSGLDGCAFGFRRQPRAPASRPIAIAAAPHHTQRRLTRRGRNLKEAGVGVSAGLKLAALPKASVQGTYSYAFVEKALDDISIDRSNASMDFGYALTHRLFLRGSGILQRTHDGLRAGSASGHPFPLPGELNTPERFAQRDRLIRTNYWHLAAGAAFSAGPVDLFASYTKYVWGRDAHNGQAFTFGTTWYFELGR
jgi:hypothetical protein